MGSHAAKVRSAPRRLTIEVLLDTTVVIDALRGRGETLRRLDSLARPPLVCAVTIEEVWRGAREPEHQAIAGLFASLRVAGLGAAEGERAGRWRNEFARRGVTLGQADCLIAAAAMSAGARLATGNRADFPMEELEVEHWPSGA